MDPVNCSQTAHSTFAWDRPKIECRRKQEAFLMAAKQPMTGMVARGGFEDMQIVDDVRRFHDAMPADIDKGHEVGGGDGCVGYVVKNPEL
jgi:hypothetical protein